MSDNNQTKTISTNFQNCAQVLEKIGELSKLFTNTLNKRPKCELVYSLSGDKKSPVHALAIWHDGSAAQSKEIEFFINNL